MSKPIILKVKVELSAQDIDDLQLAMKKKVSLQAGEFESLMIRFRSLRARLRAAQNKIESFHKLQSLGGVV